VTRAPQRAEYDAGVTCCCRAAGCEEVFKPAVARKNLRRYQKKGLGAIERQMVAAIPARDIAGARALEIGGGIGAIQSELLSKGASTGEIVELVSAYEPYARELAAAKGFQARSRFRVADVLETPDAVAHATIVILNRVVCCSPDGVRLTGVGGRLADRLLALSFPRDRWLIRLGAKTLNRGMQLFGRSFRIYLHPRATLVAAAEDAGLVVARAGNSFAWEFMTFQRPSPA
jgi:magnesium-protoporphyrin O-methyltransferase